MGNTNNKSLDKCLGAIIGAAAGDALGWPYEQNSKNMSKAEPKNKEMFQKWSRHNGGRFWSHNEEISPGEYSDDTQLIIATARSLRYGNNWSKNFTKVELPAWLSYERGGGGATKRAAQAWKRGQTPWNLEKEKKSDVERYFNAGGNGVAMRILPHVFNSEAKYEDVMHQVFINGIFTHGHPRALIGATVYADALLYVLNKENTLGYGELVDYLLERKDKWAKFPGTDKTDTWLKAANAVNNDKYSDLWESVAQEVIDLLKIVKSGIDDGALDMGKDVLDKLGCFNRKVNGAGTVTAVAAIYLASKYASSPRLGLLEAAYLKSADTDTLASMVGGLLGIIHGQEFLSNSWIDVQDYEYLKKLIYLEPADFSTVKGPIFDYSNDRFKAMLKQSKPGEQFAASPFGKMTVKDKVLNKSNADGAVIHTLKLISEGGQSVFIKLYEKETSPKSNQVQEKNKQKSGIQQRIEPQEIPNNKEKSNLMYRAILTQRKIELLVNILPTNMPANMGFLLVGDIMYEMERSGNGNIDNNGLNLLNKRWERYNITIEQIKKIKDLIYLVL